MLTLCYQFCVLLAHIRKIGKNPWALATGFIVNSRRAKIVCQPTKRVTKTLTKNSLSTYLPRGLQKLGHYYWKHLKRCISLCLAHFADSFFAYFENLSILVSKNVPNSARHAFPWQSLLRFWMLVFHLVCWQIIVSLYLTPKKVLRTSNQCWMHM